MHLGTSEGCVLPDSKQIQGNNIIQKNA